jgi:hypothetical protein
MVQSGDLDIIFDFTTVQRSAERVRDMLLALRKRFDLSPFEYARQVRIAPMEMSYSHPRITLNTWVREDLPLLSMYLHEQMHWYATWYSHAHAPQWRKLFERLRERYPAAPVGGAEGAQDEFSTYLHLLVNWLEIEAVSAFVDRERIVQHVLAQPFYRWIYRTVVNDWQSLDALYLEYRVLPIRPATDMSDEDLRLAGLTDEAPTSDPGVSNTRRNPV